MKKFLSFFLPFFSYETETVLSKERVLSKISELKPYEEAPYRSMISKNGFKVWETKFFIAPWYSYLFRKNSLLPVFVAKLNEKDGKTQIKALVRTNLLLFFWFLPIYFILLLLSAFSLVLFSINAVGALFSAWEFFPEIIYLPLVTSFFVFLLRFFFNRPAKKLVEYIEYLLVYYEKQDASR